MRVAEMPDKRQEVPAVEAGMLRSSATAARRSADVVVAEASGRAAPVAMHMPMAMI